ncbi:MAG: PTS sugar transporter subunit IIA [Victivallales bacterium]|jgi:mannitol/fructose-specific phosphotransferase system IIA component (Ntr-type)|nr:PTS sugar transporter subunit IIA [Victivallales bacterium]
MTHFANSFYSYLAVGNIICQSASKTGVEVIKELAKLLSNNNAGLSAEAIVSEIMAREALFPTVIAPGLAVPHARLSGLEKPLVAMATNGGGIDFNAPDFGPVKVVLMLLTPGDDPGLHLQLLSALAKDFCAGNVIDQIAALPGAEEIVNYFNGSGFTIPDYLRVRDVMTRKVTTVLEQDVLQRLIELFAVTGESEFPVVDDDGDLRGVVSLSDLLRFSMPEHVLWLEDLTPMYRFQPFSEVLKSAHDTKVADLMRTEFVSVDESVPAVQLAKLFLVNNINQLVVVDAAGKLAGTVNLKKFAARLFWE